VRLTRLRIDRFRNVKPGTEMQFGPTFNVLLGKNATGKTTLLDLVAAVTNDNLSPYAKEAQGFDLTWMLEDGPTGVQVHAVRSPAEPAALPNGRGESEIGREESNFDDRWTIDLLAAGRLEASLERSGAHGHWKPEGSLKFELKAPPMSAYLALRDAYIETHRTMDQWLYMMEVEGGGVHRFDEALEAFGAISQAGFSRRRANIWTQSAWVPTNLVGAVHVRSDGAPDSPVIALQELGAVSSIPALLGFEHAHVHPRFLQRSQTGDVAYQGLDFFFQRADGSSISHELLSFGQKRLFAFLWYLAVRRERPIVADELLNGLHHDWIQLCLDRLYDRQSFLATQHPYLLDYIPIESAAAVRTTFIRCTLEGDGGHQQMVWRNFDEEEAARFFVAYQTGVQQVSAVLRWEGLW
jgi:hypothetical protein